MLQGGLTYNSIFFLGYLFLFFLAFFLCKSVKSRQVCILVANIIFYISSGVAAFGIVIMTAIVVYLVTGKIEKIYQEFEKEEAGLKPKEKTQKFNGYKKKARKYLYLAFVCIIGIWTFIKIGRFLNLENIGLIVPLGISYYTLSSVGYVLDVYWRKTKPEHNFFLILTAMIYFPHIVQGPISKYESLIQQLKELPALEYERFCFGLQLMFWGYIKKLVIADRLSIYTTTVFSSIEEYAGLEVLIAVIFCAVQIYMDFSGCMDIVRGISQAIGIQLAENFRNPFFSKSATEFWTRWHITLGAWTKEYIYLPIAMNPKFVKYTKQCKKSGKEWYSSFIKAIVPLSAVWLFTGLWHGTGMDYIVWGMYWCFIMTLSKELKWLGERTKKLFRIESDRMYYSVFQMLRTFLLFAIGRTFTVMGSLTGCVALWKQMFQESRVWVLFDEEIYSIMERKDFWVALFFIGVALIVDILHEHHVEIRRKIAAQPILLRWMVYYAAAFAIIIVGIYGPEYDVANFVYGAF